MENKFKNKQKIFQPEPPQIKAKKVKLRLDVKDVVRGPDYVGKCAESIDGISVLYEDNHLLVVVKPQNIPTQADSSGDEDMLSKLKAYLVKKYNKPGEAYLGLVHRLDRPTGGVMVFAKTSKAASRLCEQIKNPDSDFEKNYAAITFGRPNRTGIVEHFLVKDSQTNTVTVAPSTLEGAKKAVSEISLLDEKNGLSLVKVKLITGRTHQARVQLKALCAPIVGDRRYAPDTALNAKFLALWAYRLVFTHPVSGDKMTFLAAPPDEYPWTEFDTASFTDVVRPVDTNRYFG